MRKAYILLAFGIWVTILPFLGFPYSWKNVLVAITGLGIIYFSFVIYKESREPNINGEGGSKENNFDNFSENNFSGNDKSEEK